MNLLQHIRNDRTEKRRKEPFKTSLFNRIGGIVKIFSVGNEFTEALGAATDALLNENFESVRIKKKPGVELPLYPLLTEDQYRLTEKIVNSVNNTYLHFAASPDEIFLCDPLFLRNPAIENDKLIQHHFETLLLYEFSKEKKKNLKQRVVEMLEEKNETSAQEQVKINSLMARIERIEAFIGNIDRKSS